ncbi:MAG: hypothetical protein ABSA64_03880 [Sedimentisphaerales bacterium]|jgi:hypothetical protein
MFSQNQRWFVIQSIRYVKQAFIATGSGWLDAEQEIYKKSSRKSTRSMKMATDPKNANSARPTELNTWF